MEWTLDSLKSFFGQMKHRSTEVAETAADKARDAARLAKLTVDLNSEKDALKKAYLELGKAYFEEKHDQADGVLVQLCGEVEAVRERMNDLQTEIDRLREAFKKEEPDVEVEITQEPDTDEPAEETPAEEEPKTEE